MEGLWLGWLGKNYVYLKELEGWDSERARILIKLSWLNLLEGLPQIGTVFVNASLIWKAIEKTKPLITKGACYLVGNGASINVWVDLWIPWLAGFKPTLKDDSIQ